MRWFAGYSVKVFKSAVEFKPALSCVTRNRLCLYNLINSLGILQKTSMVISGQLVFRLLLIKKRAVE